MAEQPSAPRSGTPRGLMSRVTRFLAPMVARVGEAVGRGLSRSKMVNRAVADAAARELKRRRRFRAVRRFLMLPRWYQDALRPGFRQWRKPGRHTNRPASAELQALRMHRAEVKRQRKGAIRLQNAARGGFTQQAVAR